MLAGVAVLGYLAATFVQVWRTAAAVPTRPAQAIVVMGAAQYNGRPSPVFAARLDHAADLYRDGLAPLVVVTGGRRPGDSFSEASSADLYLQAAGVPPEALLLETQGRTSYESLAATARFLMERDIRDVIVVSDPWHLHRSAEIAERVGLQPRLAGAPASRYSTITALRQMLRETAAVAVGRIIGYRRLDRLSLALSG